MEAMPRELFYRLGILQHLNFQVNWLSKHQRMIVGKLWTLKAAISAKENQSKVGSLILWSSHRKPT